MRNHITGESREQVQMLPPTIEEYVGENNPVRVIDAYVDSLDLVKLAFKRSDLADVGRLPYHPAVLLKLYLYGYFYGVRSSRKLEAETNRNLEVMWLIRALRPDDKTIANFRSENAKAIRGVFIEFRITCENLGLYGKKTVAIDGTKIKASNSKKRSFTKEALQKRIKEMEAEAENFLSEMAKNDQSELKIPKLDAAGIKKRIEELDERLAEYRRHIEEMTAENKTQVALTDADCKRMVNGQGRTEPCYNIQMAVDSKNILIVDYKTTNECNDSQQLHSMALASKKALGVSSLEALADAGYANGAEVLKCDKDEITAYVPPKSVSGFPTREGIPTKEYTVDKFIYDAASDCYTCPQKETLNVVKDTIQEGEKVKFYKTLACLGCTARAQCTSSQDGRTVRRTESNEAMVALNQRVAENPEKTKVRGQIVEPVFGILKTAMAMRQFLVRGLAKVDAEVGLGSTAFNLKRAINILSVPVLLAAIANAG